MGWVKWTICRPEAAVATPTRLGVVKTSIWLLSGFHNSMVQNPIDPLAISVASVRSCAAPAALAENWQGFRSPKDEQEPRIIVRH